VKKWKIAIAGMGIALSVLPGPASADGKFSLRLQGGWAYLSAGDINPGTQAYFDWREAQWGASEFGYRAAHNGFELGGDIIYELTPRLGLGLGVGYLRISRASRSFLSIPDVIGPYASLDVDPTLTALPIRLGLYLTIPLNRTFNFNADAGASVYLRARYSDVWRMAYQAMDTEAGYIDITTQTEKKAAPIGFQGGIGLEYKLSRKLFLCLDARGRYARFRGLEGSSALTSDFRAPFSEHGILYYESVPMLTGSPRLIMVQNSPPDGPGGEPRQAVVDFSGVSLQAGIRIQF